MNKPIIIPQNLPAKWGYKATKNEKAEGLHWGEKPVNLSGPIRFYLGGRAKTAGAVLNFRFPTCLWISPSPVISASFKASSSKAGRFRTETESLDNPNSTKSPRQNPQALTGLDNLQQRTVHPRASDSQKMDLQWPSTDSTHRIPTSMDSHGQVALTLYFTSLQAQFTTCVTSGCSSNLGYGAMVPKRLHGSMLMWIKQCHIFTTHFPGMLTIPPIYLFMVMTGGWLICGSMWLHWYPVVDPCHRFAAEPLCPCSGTEVRQVTTNIKPFLCQKKMLVLKKKWA